MTDKRVDTAFQQGYVCAVAIMVKLHDEPTIAKDLLKELDGCNWRSIEQYDRDILKKAGIKLCKFKALAARGK